MFKSKKRLILEEKYDDVLALLSDYGYDKIGESIIVEKKHLMDKTLKLQVEEIEKRVCKLSGYIVNEIITEDLLAFIKDFFSMQLDEDYVHTLNELIDEDAIDTFSCFLYGRCQAMVSINLAKVLTGMFVDKQIRSKYTLWSYFSRAKRKEIERNAGL